MIGRDKAKLAEIDRNLERFLEILPTVIGEHADEYVLLRNGTAIDYYSTAIDAQMAGNQLYEDRLFSIQHVKLVPEELGHFAYAIPSGKP